jgi:hypothetical protein
VCGIAYAPDGSRFASVDLDGMLRVWDADTTAELFCITCHGRRVVYSPDGQRIVSGGGGMIEVWDAGSGECLETIEGSGEIPAIAAGDASRPWRAIWRREETVIEDTVNGAPVGWFPYGLGLTATHPCGRTWAGIAWNNLHVVTLEGAEDPQERGQRPGTGPQPGNGPFVAEVGTRRRWWQLWKRQT